MILRIAMLSIHAGPLGRLGTRDTGGMSVYVRELARALGGQGHRVDIFTRQTEAGMSQVVTPWSNVRIIYIGLKWAGEIAKSALYDHTNAFVNAMDEFRQKTGVDYDLIHSNYWLSGVIGQRLRALWHSPHVITFHTLGAAKMAARSDHREHNRRVSEEARLVQQCDGALAPTIAERERLASLQHGRSEKIHIVPCGVDLSRFKPLILSDSGPKKRTVHQRARLLFVGRFDPMKGIQLLLASVARLSSALAVELTIIGGDGPDSPEHQIILHGSQELGLENRVRILGPVEHNTMPRHYNTADAVVVSSRYESFGLVILESLASGTPVASTPVGVAPHIIRPGVNGYLAAAKDDRSLAEAIVLTLQLAREQDPMSIRATVADFGWPRVASMLLDAYDTVLTQTLDNPMGIHHARTV